MNNSDNAKKKTGEYEAFHKPIIASEGLKPINIILPIIVIILIIAIICRYAYVQRTYTVANAERVMNQMAEYIAVNISNEIDYAQSSIKLASLTISQTMTDDNIENPAELILPMVENTPFGSIEYIRVDGMNVMNIGEPFDASDRVYYIEGIKGNTGIWNNYHPKTSKETLMNFYTPLMYEGKIAGVITGYIQTTSQVSPLFEKTLYGRDIYGFLVDENNMVICSTIESEYVNDLTLDVFLDRFNIAAEEKQKVSNTINNAADKAECYKNPRGQGRICVTKIPGTEWKVAIIVPEESFDAIINDNTRDSVITIVIIGLLLITYAACVLIRNVRRRKLISLENEKLEEENRSINEENQKAFYEIAEIRDIIASANMGTWRIELIEGKEPRMYVDDTMKELLGVSDTQRTPEQTYKDWYENITPAALPSVLKSVEIMQQGQYDENTYLWMHPSKGERYVRCGGTAEKIEGGVALRGYHYDVDDVVREDIAKVIMLQNALDEKNDYYSTLGTLGGIFNSVHVIDIVGDTVVEFGARNEIKEIVNHKSGIVEMMTQVMSSLVTEEYKEKALEFTNLSTVSERMKNKKVISTQLISKDIGWFIASFITMEVDDNGRPTRVIFTTRSIDEEKKQEERLIAEAQTDELTGLLNRHAFETELALYKSSIREKNFIYMSLDVNGLKVVNDTLGHAAGDELIVGAAGCMKRSLGQYGKLYRTGGDEFTAILYCDVRTINEITEDFEEEIASWRGRMVESLSISYGWVCNEEEPELSISQLGVIADERMYQAKTNHYLKSGVDRRGQKDAHKALCESYTKILKINVTEDSYQIIDMDVAERKESLGFADTISDWLKKFGETGQVHPDDLQEFLEKTDIQYVRDYFSEDKTSLHVFYRRKLGQVFKQVMMEIIPANDYGPDNQSLFLYVKNIDK